MTYTVILSFSDRGDGRPGMYMSSTEANDAIHARNLVLSEATRHHWFREDLCGAIVIEGQHDDLLH